MSNCCCTENGYDGGDGYSPERPDDTEFRMRDWFGIKTDKEWNDYKMEVALQIHEDMKSSED